MYIFLENKNTLDNNFLHKYSYKVFQMNK
ncbi:hypothetical protein PFMC_05358 [Plasmodium falciparum CAMP/Malaysia]|uniref:Uncharacterized protein n=1 Tax=Plasmodium falciparum (isolate Camp / Malaysia) TaxID=5835 RepID=A0A024WYR2_PLAFC|nr:hypothetical protein PFMC_05358 [Plasmodium falciparum CAMP/Malaysia]